MLSFTVGDAEPGDTVAPGSASWTLDLRSAVSVDSVTVFVNGDAVWTEAGLDAPGQKQFSGELDLPDGGWVTVRAHGGDSGWPMMDSYPYAETNPIWIGEIGSTDPGARREAATDLLKVLDASEQKLHQGYGDTDIPNLQQHFDDARRELEEQAQAE